MFGNLLVDYIKRKGFKQQVIIGQRSGREFKGSPLELKDHSLKTIVVRMALILDLVKMKMYQAWKMLLLAEWLLSCYYTWILDFA